MQLVVGRAFWLVSVAIAMLTLVPACSYNNPPRTNIVPPCGREGISRVDLGRPFGKSAQFNTLGGVLYATAHDFGPRRIGDPEVGRTRLDIGKGTPEAFQPGSTPDDPLLSISLVEDDFNKFEVPAGTYWAVSSSAANIAIVSCEAGGVSDVAPAS